MRKIILILGWMVLTNSIFGEEKKNAYEVYQQQKEKGVIKSTTTVDIYEELERYMRKASRPLGGTGRLTPEEKKRRNELLEQVDKKRYQLLVEKIEKEEREEERKKLMSCVEKNIKKLKKGFNEKTLGYAGEFTILDLGRAGDSRAVPILTKILLEYDINDKGTPNKAASWEVRKCVAEALGSIGDLSAIPSLRKAYEKEKDIKIRSNCFNAIVNIRMIMLGYKPWMYPIPEEEKPMVRKVLTELLNDKDEIVRYGAVMRYWSWLNPENVEKEKILSIIREISQSADDTEIQRKAINFLEKIEMNK
ncbi:MAG: HEAT repeat domain-containing protein [Elusimicrobiota bacterium]